MQSVTEHLSILSLKSKSFFVFIPPQVIFHGGPSTKSAEGTFDIIKYIFLLFHTTLGLFIREKIRHGLHKMRMEPFIRV